MDTESEVKSERMEEYIPVYGPTSHTDLSSRVCISIDKNEKDMKTPGLRPRAC